MKAPGFWQRPPGPMARLLAPAGTLVAAAARRRQRRARPAVAGVPVICVGNLVVGGAGKTPVAIALGRLLETLGQRPAFLCRGYRGRLAGPVAVDLARHDARAVGDEALLLAAHAPTWVARDRAAGARAAVAAGAGAIVMDDGFQNPGLAKDLSLLVVDGATGLGNGLVLPAGPLRERPRDGLARAHAIVLMGADATGAATTLAGGRPLLRARLVPEPAAPWLHGARVLAFAGIARPEKLFDTLRRNGARLVAAVGFPDHHVYTEDEIMRLVERAAAAGAAPVTTAKDFARLPEAARPMVRVLTVAVRWDDEAAVRQLLVPLVPSAPAVLAGSAA